MTTTAEKIAVMQAWEEGKPIEYFSTWLKKWINTDRPMWDWSACDYRIAAKKPSINWDHVSPEYNWLARDESDDADLTCFLYTGKPSLASWGEQWVTPASAKYASAEGFASLDRGTCDWKDSLVMRPGYEGD